MNTRQFDGDGWIARLAAAIENDVSRSDPPWLDYPLRPPRESAEGNRVWRLAQYRSLASRAKTDQIAAQQFAGSQLRYPFDPMNTMSILREHPVLARADADSEGLDRVYIQLTNRTVLFDFDSLLLRLGKISLIKGADGAAHLLHRFLTDGDVGRLPATEIIVVHGLSVDRCFALPEGASLAPYEDTRQRYNLPDDPVAWLKSARIDPGSWNRSAATAALVRPIAWRPGFYSSSHDAEKPFQTVRYGFPLGHAVESVGALFQDRSLLVDLLSVVVGSKLLWHTSFTAVPDWIRQIDPNVAHHGGGGRASMFDVWPRDTELDEGGAATFAALAAGWIAYRRGDRSIDLALRRVASSLGPATRDFGLEDRLLDLGVAMEAMYGPMKIGRIERKLRSRASRLLAKSGNGPDIGEAVERLYKARSNIVHGNEPPPRDELENTLFEARELARDSLDALLRRGCKPDWSKPLDNAGIVTGNSKPAPASD